MSKGKYKKKDFGYYLLQIVKRPLRWYMNRKFNLNIVKNDTEGDEGPFIIIGNHVMNYDPLIALAYTKPFVKFVAASNNYDNRLKRILFKIARVIPINKKNSDISTIRTLLNEVNAGNSVGLFPEGGRNWNGETDEIIYSTAKLIKMLKIRVYNQKLTGGYLSTPRWCKTTRKGILNINIYKMLEADEVKKLTVDEIYQLMKEHLYHNEYEYQREAMIPYVGVNYAMYVERLVYGCPVCESMNKIYSDKDEMICPTCNTHGVMDQYGFIKGDFPYDNLVDFDHHQKRILPVYLDSQFEDLFIGNVKYKRFENKKIKKQLVNLIIKKNAIVIDYFGEDRIEFPYDEISPITLTFENTFTFYQGETRHQFLIEPFLHNTSIMFIHDAINYLRGNLDV